MVKSLRRATVRSPKRVKAPPPRRTSKESRIIRLIRLFEESLAKLGARMPPDQLERRALLIHRVMTAASRGFHQLDHVFEVAEGLAPAEALAAIYHDTVYAQIDQGIAPDVYERIKDDIWVEGSRYFVKRARPDDSAALVAEIFDAAPGSELSLLRGMNEHLSALLAVKELSIALPEAVLAEIAAAIEQTIPFRGDNADGQSAAEALAGRLGKLSQRRRWGWSPDDLDEVVRRCVSLGNNDVWGFAADDPALFLDGTWKLLAEANPELHTIGVYSIRHFRIALQKMERFLGGLKPQVVFHEYRDYPDRKTWRDLQKRTTANLATAVHYLRVKLLAMAVLEALAELTGGDAPVAFFLGSSREVEPDTFQLHELLPPPEQEVADLVLDNTLLQLFETGRRSRAKFDTRGSPLSAYLYKMVGKSGITRLMTRARRTFDGDLSWEQFLDGMPAGFVTEMAAAAAQIAVTRTEKLVAIADRARARKRR